MGGAVYQRFTDRARLAMIKANQEASRFQLEYIGAEHVLLGIIDQDDSTAMRVLAGFQVDVAGVRVDLQDLIGTGLPPRPRMKAVIEAAMEESHLMEHRYVGTEHLLLGLLREPENLAGSVLRRAGLDLGRARQAVAEQSSGGRGSPAEPIGPA